MLTTSAGLAAFADRLHADHALTRAEREAVLALPFRVRTMAAHAQLYREEQPGDECFVLLDGHAIRSKLMATGGRQILAVLMRGDLVNHEHLLMRPSDHGVEALGCMEVAVIASAALHEAMRAHAGIGRALWAGLLREVAVQRAWTTSIGRRDARARLSHLLCELAVRQEAAGLGPRDRLHLPLTQTRLADCAGLTPVHVNRVLQGLRGAGVIESQGRTVAIGDWRQLCAIADFRPRYLTGEAPPSRGERVSVFA
jgi:CRP-like cAMP-binding protein